MRPERPVVVFPTVGTRVGGSVVSTATMVEALRRRGRVDARVVMPRSAENLRVFEERDLAVDVYDLPVRAVRRIRSASGPAGYLAALPSLYTAYRRARTFLAAVPSGVVHLNDDRSFLPWAWAGHRAGFAVIWHVRQERPSRYLDALRLRLSDQLLFVAEANRSRFAGRSMLPPSETLYNWIDLGTFRPADDRAAHKRRLGFDEHAPLVGFVGNLVARKRPEWAIDAFRALVESGIDTHMAVVGSDFSSDGSVLARLLARAADTEDRIRFLGYRSDVPELMRAFDVLVLPSAPRGEAFPRVVLEAMASGAAVVATRVAGVAEAVEDGVSGMLVEPEDPAAFHRALDRVVRDHELRHRLQAAGMSRVRKRFSEGRTVETLERIYQRLAAGR